MRSDPLVSRIINGICLWMAVTSMSYAQRIPSRVYAWQAAPVVRHVGYEERILLTGSTHDFSSFLLRGITQLAHQPAGPARQAGNESLVIVKEGELTLLLAGKAKTLGPGSVVLIKPGDTCRLDNRTTRPLTYYLMEYRANQLPQSTPNQPATSSFWVDWNEVPYQPHEKGGVRRMFDRPTAMTKRFEMHVTTLKAGLWSHPPHTHRAAEILLPIDSAAQESIDGVLEPASVGDIIFLESNVPHAIQNNGQRSCTYFAFQFE